MEKLILVVDDEKPIIEELLSIIDWQSINCEICGYNTDSVTALDEILEKSPYFIKVFFYMRICPND